MADILVAVGTLILAIGTFWMASESRRSNRLTTTARLDAGAAAVAIFPVGELHHRWASSMSGGEPNQLPSRWTYTVPREGAEMLLVGGMIELHNEGVRSAIVSFMPAWDAWQGGCRWQWRGDQDLALEDLHAGRLGSGSSSSRITLADGRTLLPPGARETLQVLLGMTVSQWIDRQPCGVSASVKVSDAFDPTVVDTWTIEFTASPLERDAADMGKLDIAGSPAEIHLARSRSYGLTGSAPATRHE